MSNIRLHREVSGEGEVGAVFIHPNPWDHRAWLYQVAHFSSWFRTLAIDLPGYGRSRWGGGRLSMDGLAEATWSLVDDVTVGPVVLIGVSVGSGVVLRMAASRPGRTKALILSGAGFRAERGYANDRAKRYVTDGVAFRREHLMDGFSESFRGTRLAEYLGQIVLDRPDLMDVGEVVDLLRARSEPDTGDLLDAVQAPVLVITGSEDTAHPAAFDLQRRLQDGEVVTIQGAGHACHIERPWEWDDAALGFLRRRGVLAADSPAQT